MVLAENYSITLCQNGIAIDILKFSVLVDTKDWRSYRGVRIRRFSPLTSSSSSRSFSTSFSTSTTVALLLCPSHLSRIPYASGNLITCAGCRNDHCRLHTNRLLHSMHQKPFTFYDLKTHYYLFQHPLRNTSFFDYRNSLRIIFIFS